MLVLTSADAEARERLDLLRVFGIEGFPQRLQTSYPSALRLTPGSGMELDREEPDVDAGTEPDQQHDPAIEPAPAEEDELWRPFRKVRRFRGSAEPRAGEHSPDA